MFTVNLPGDGMILYRLNSKPLKDDSVYKGDLLYKEQMDAYIDKYVVPEDKQMMQEQCSAGYIAQTLKSTESFVIHYRVMLGGKLRHFYRRIVRIGDADSFENIVVGVADEDEAVAANEKQISMENTLRLVELSSTTGLLTKEAFFIYADRVMANYPDTDFDITVLRIENYEALGHQFGVTAQNKVMQTIGEILQGYQSEKKCIAYMNNGTFASVT